MTTYTVVEHAGEDNEAVVYEDNSILKALKWALVHYPDVEERAELGVDILKDGSTEY